ncbi:MAG: hypothetical protein PHC40_02820 [Eubacteriales bacterium]|nr:hypothetical protein [Eubacteriales bacterium]
MKKAFIIFMILMLTISFSACGNSKAEEAAPEEEQSTEAQDSQRNFERIVPLNHEELMGVITPDSRLLLTIKEEALGVVMQPFEGIIKRPGNLQLVDLSSYYIYTCLFYPAGTYGSLDNIAKEYGGEIGVNAAGESVVNLSLEDAEIEISIAEEGAPDGWESIWFQMSANEEQYNSNLISLVNDGIYPQVLFDTIQSNESPIISTVHYMGLNEWNDDNYVYFQPTLSPEELQKLSGELMDGFREAGYAEGTVPDEDVPVLVKSQGLNNGYNSFTYVLNEMEEDSKCGVEYYEEW